MSLITLFHGRAHTLFWLACWSIAGFPWTANAQRFLPTAHPKYQIASQVYTDLVRARGDHRFPPKLRIQRNGFESKMKAAWFELGKWKAINIDENVYDLCRSFGTDSLNALAFVLGHELSHFYDRHDWGADFGNAFADLTVGKTIQELHLTPKRKVELETEADTRGGFYGYVAGYNTLGIAGDLLSAIYHAYNWDEQMVGYPSLAERKAIALASQDSLARLVPIFEAGNHLLTLKAYEEAAQLFYHLVQAFPSREIWNNLGVARALGAIKLFMPGEVEFAYPLEFDADSRLSLGTAKGASSEQEERRNRLLAEAGNAFKKSKELDPRYATAFVNLACVLDLRGRYNAALGEAEEALEIATKDNLVGAISNALLVRGITNAHRNDRENALTDFRAAAQTSPLGAFNLAILQPDAGLGVAEAPGSRPSEGEERIDGRAPSDLSLIVPLDVEMTVPVAGHELKYIFVLGKRTVAWEAIQIEGDRGIFQLLATRPGYGGVSSRGISLSSSVAEMHAKYGAPDYISRSRQWSSHVYEYSNILFIADNSNRIRKWILFYFLID